MTFDVVTRHWFPNMASALLVAVLHVGLVWLMLISVGGQSSIAIRAKQVSLSTVLILTEETVQQPAKTAAITNSNAPDLASSLAVTVQTPNLPRDAVASDSVLPVGGLRVSWISADEPSEEVLRWREAVRQAIERTWVKPNGSGVDSNCRVKLIQNSSGGVIGTRVSQCNAEDSVRSSLVTAIFHASPLPPYPSGQPAKDAEIDCQIYNASRGT